MATQKTTALTTQEPMTFKALTRSPDKIRQALITALGGQQFQVKDFKELRVPAGAGTFWTIPTSEGNKPAEVVEGVVIWQTPTQALWTVDLDEARKKGLGNRPPDCKSADGVTGSESRAWIYENAQKLLPVTTKGIVNPGPRASELQDCVTCPFNQFGTAKDGAGNGKKCQAKRRIYTLMPDRALPVVVVAPAMSLNPARDYFLGLVDELYSPTEVTTKFSLEAVQAQPPYSRIKFTRGAELDEDTQAKIVQYQAAIVPFLEKDASEAVASGRNDAPAPEPQVQAWVRVDPASEVIETSEDEEESAIEDDDF